MITQQNAAMIQFGLVVFLALYVMWSIIIISKLRQKLEELKLDYTPKEIVQGISSDEIDVLLIQQDLEKSNIHIKKVEQQVAEIKEIRPMKNYRFNVVESKYELIKNG